MNRTGGDSGKKDRRALALLLFALTILMAAALRTGHFFGHTDPSAGPAQQIVWRDDPVAPGLYRVGAGSADDQASHSFPAKTAPLFFKPIPVNRADAELLATIPGIGPVFAQRIIEFRDQQGGITAIEELDAVRGIGPAKLRILHAHLVAD